MTSPSSGICIMHQLSPQSIVSRSELDLVLAADGAATRPDGFTSAAEVRTYVSTVTSKPESKNGETKVGNVQLIPDDAIIGFLAGLETGLTMNPQGQGASPCADVADRIFKAGEDCHNREAQSGGYLVWAKYNSLAPFAMKIVDALQSETNHLHPDDITILAHKIVDARWLLSVEKYRLLSMLAEESFDVKQALEVIDLMPAVSSGEVVLEEGFWRWLFPISLNTVDDRFAPWIYARHHALGPVLRRLKELGVNLPGVELTDQFISNWNSRCRLTDTLLTSSIVATDCDWAQAELVRLKQIQQAQVTLGTALETQKSIFLRDRVTGLKR